MSGVIPDSIITVSMPITPNGWPAPYRIISFPTRVKVTAASFTVDAISAGNPEDGRTFQLVALKGRKAKGSQLSDTFEDITPFFGWDEKPQVSYPTNMWNSDIKSPVEKGEWYTYGPSYTGDIAQMDTDEYLTVWIYPNNGDFPNDFDWAATTATISIAYTGATNLD